jgi:ketosteroid isomerase-like protein
MSETIHDAIAGANAAFVSNFNRGDIAAAANVYTAKARIFPPGLPPVDGQADIAEFWSTAAAQLGVTNVRLTTIEIEAHGDTAIEEGRFTLGGKSGPLNQGKYIVIWKRQPDGAWKWHRDIWNSNQV